MAKNEIVKFVRCMAYAHIFTAPFTSQNPITAGVVSLACLALLYITD
jgi:hypothetical protein